MPNYRDPRRPVCVEPQLPAAEWQSQTDVEPELLVGVAFPLNDREIELEPGVHLPAELHVQAQAGLDVEAGAAEALLWADHELEERSDLLRARHAAVADPTAEGGVGLLCSGEVVHGELANDAHVALQLLAEVDHHAHRP